MFVKDILTHYLGKLGIPAQSIEHFKNPNDGRLSVVYAQNYDEVFKHLPALVQAFRDGKSLLLITEATRISDLGCAGDIDLLSMLHPIMKYNTVITHVEQLAIKLNSAVVTATRKSCPTHIMIPTDFLAADIENPVLWDIHRHIDVEGKYRKVVDTFRVEC